MNLMEPMDWDRLVCEYGVRGKRLLPWEGVTPPFGGAWVVVDPGTVSLEHVNEPRDEEELFICLQGRATARVGEQTRELHPGDVVYLAPGVPHRLENPHDTACHLYCLWWNQGSVEQCLASRRNLS